MSRADDIEEQAAAWIARRDRGGNGWEAGLAAWLAADPRHRAAYLRLTEAWRRSERLERLRPADGVIDKDLLAPPRMPTVWTRLRRRERESDGSERPRSNRRTPRVLGWSTAAAALAAAAFLVSWFLTRPAGELQRTGPGDLYRVVLADGSAIILNADTEVRIHYVASSRSVTLVRGEAQFLVKRDPQWPFDVHANGHIVRDIGTHFDVRLDAGRSLDVLVTEGRIAVLPATGARAGKQPPAGNVRTISAGELAVIGASRVTVRHLTPVEISRRLWWKHRELRFQGQTLSQAVAEFNRSNSPQLVIADPAIESLRIGGDFNLIDTDSFVAALNQSFGIFAREYDGRIYLYQPGTH